MRLAACWLCALFLMQERQDKDCLPLKEKLPWIGIKELYA
jgi:hypothetical protein